MHSKTVTPLGKKQQFAQNVLSYIALFILGCLVWISQYNVFQTDDFIYASQTRDLGFFHSCLDLYTRWGGRFFSYSLNSLSLAGNEHFWWIPKLFPPFLWLLFLLGLFLNFKSYFKNTTGEAVKNSLIFFLFYTLCLGNIAEHYFWISGATVYFLPVILLLFYFFVSLKKSVLCRIVEAILIILILGSNEFVALLLLSVLISRLGKMHSRRNVVLGLIGICFFLVAFLAPGNFSRYDAGGSTLLITLLKKSAVLLYNSGYAALKTGLLLPLFIFIFKNTLSMFAAQLDPRGWRFLAAATAVCFLLLSYMFLLMPGRAGELSVVLLLLTVASGLAKYSIEISRFWWVSILALCLPKIQVINYKVHQVSFNYNIVSIFEDTFVTDLKAYEAEISERADILENSEEENVVLKPIQTLPKVLYFDEMGSLRNENYVNDQMEKFYRKKSVSILKPGDEVK